MIDPGSFNLGTALTNLSAAFGSITKLIVALSYVIGVGMMAKGVMSYRIFANQTFGSAQRGELAGPMVWLFVGALLVYLPATMDSTMITVFGTDDVGDSSELIAYAGATTADWAKIAEVVIQYIKLIGFIAFVRGWIILSKMGHSGAQPGSIGKGIIHVVGGILLINVVDTVKILAQTFGYVGA